MTDIAFDEKSGRYDFQLFGDLLTYLKEVLLLGFVILTINMFFLYGQVFRKLCTTFMDWSFA